MQNYKAHVEAQLATDRHNAQYSARPLFATQTPAERAGELIARMEISKAHGNKEAFLAAQAELRQLVEEI